ncbi:MAG: DUF4159 domain-containing protein [Kiritimatiellia bacterium]
MQDAGCGVTQSSSHRVAGAATSLLCVVFALLLAVPSARAESDWFQNGMSQQLKVYDGRGSAKKEGEEIDRRGKVTIRRLIPKCHSDWGNDPTALPYFFYQVGLRTEGDFKIPYYIDNAGLEITSEEIFQYPIIYFTSHFPFTFTEEEVVNLKKYVERGGTLWLDDCTGSGPFMESVPQNVQRIAPGSEMKQMLREIPEFFDLYNMVYAFPGVPQIIKAQFSRPFQAAYVRGRPAIIFCPNDYGCMWEISTPPTALNPLGVGAHGDGYGGGTQAPGSGLMDTRETVYRFSINWLLYTLMH